MHKRVKKQLAGQLVIPNQVLIDWFADKGPVGSQIELGGLLPMGGGG